MNAPTTPTEFIDEFLTGLIVEVEAAERAAAMANKQRRLPAVEIVRKHLANGMQQKQVAALYGVSAPAVSQLLKRAAEAPPDPAPKPAGVK